MSVPIIKSYQWDITDFRRGVRMMIFREGEPLATKYFYTTHSELNAILNYRGGSLEGATMYVTLFPCNECAKAIIQAGIRRLVYGSDKYDGTPGVIASKRMLSAAGILMEAIRGVRSA